MKRTLLYFTLLILPWFASAQKPWQFSFDGYLNNNQGIFFDTLKNQFILYNFIHNRLNFDLYYNTNLQIHLSARTRLFYGNNLGNLTFSDMAETYDYDPGFFDLSHNWSSGTSYLLNSQIDRAYIKYTAGNFELTLGRQRINWAKTMVWNPNDIFNTYSLFEIDYPERPGTDAIDAVYYWGVSSSLETAASLDHDTNLTAAIKLATTIKTYDLQLIAGYYKSRRYIAGLGWTGYIKNLTFRGEISSFWTKDGKWDNIMVSSGIDFAHGQKLMFMSEMLYSYKAENNISNLLLANPQAGYAALFNAPNDIYYIALEKFNIFCQLMYQLTPLISLNIGGMLMLQSSGYTLMPNIDFSLSQNVDFNIGAQLSKFTIKNPYLNQDQHLKLNLILFKLSYNFGK